MVEGPAVRRDGALLPRAGLPTADRARPAVVGSGLLPGERAALATHHWVAWPELRSLPDRVEPPRLPAVLGALVPDGPWGRSEG